MKYNTIGEIQDCLGSLEKLNKLTKSRKKSGYDDHERLDWFMILGRWVLDECGNCGKVLGKSLKERFPAIPDIITREALSEFLRANGSDEGYSHSFEHGIPPERVVCSVCGEKWTIENCHDTVELKSNIVMSLKEHVGTTLKALQELLNQKTDGIYWFCYDKPIRNDRYIDLTPLPDYKTLKVNEKGWVGKEKGIDENYVIQEGDDVYVYVFKFAHYNCHRTAQAKAEKENFLDIFYKAGYKVQDIAAIPNEYCPCTVCAPWYLVKTAVGTFKIGWRKRVINIDWSKTNLQHVMSLFTKEDVTKNNWCIHAWGTEKAIEYLATMKTLV
jgi:hypothetical protein